MRYDVFPQGAYSVGDQWYSVVSHFDAGGTFGRVNETGWGYGGCMIGCCPGGTAALGCCGVTMPDGTYICGTDPGGFPVNGWYRDDRGCGIAGCESTFYQMGYTEDWRTVYNVYEFRPAEWQIVNGIEFDRTNPAHGWMLRGQETRVGYFAN